MKTCSSTPLLPPFKLRCNRCDGLRMGILKQIGAFKILASLNPNLSWTILVTNLEELLRVGSEEKTVPPENGQSEIVEIDIDENDGVKENQNNFGSIETHHGGDSVMDFGSQRPRSAAASFTPESKRRKKKMEEKLTECGLNKNSSEIAPTLENPLSGERLQETNKFIRTNKRGPHLSFECLLCHKSLTLKRNTQLHIRRVHMGDRLPCTECSLKFYDYKTLGEHRVKCHGASKPSCSSDVLFSSITEGHQKSGASVKESGHEKSKRHDKTKKKKKNKTSLSNRNKEITGPSSHYLNSITVRNPFKNFDLRQALTAKVVMDRLPDADPDPKFRPSSSSFSRKKVSKTKPTTPPTTTPTTTPTTIPTTTATVDSHNNFPVLEKESNSQVDNNKSQDDDDSGSIVVKIDPYDMAGVQIKVDTEEMMDQPEELMALYMPERYMNYGEAGGGFPENQDCLFPAPSQEPPYPSVPPFSMDTGGEALDQNISEGPVQSQSIIPAGSRVTKEQVDSRIRKSVTTGKEGSVATFECLMCPKTFKKRVTANVHVRKIHFQERIRCDRCEQTFYDGLAFRKHETQC